MCQQQFDAEVMDELKQQEYNTKLGIYHFLGDNTCESTFIYCFRNSGTDGQVGEMGA